MNAWSEPTVMSANKVLLASLSLAIIAAPSDSFAQESVATAPSLYAVGEFQVQHARIANPKASGNCGTSTGEATKMVVGALKANKLPTLHVIGAPAALKNVERIDVFPDIVTLQPRDNECVTWVSLTAQSRAALRLQPVPTPRDLAVTYWTGGLMVGSPAANHPTSLHEAIQKLSQQLARQYFADQPPTIKDPLPAATAVVPEKK